MCPETRLQLSEDTQFLMEVQGNLVAAIYKRIELDTVDEHGFTEVKWTRLKHLRQYPKLLQGACYANFLFSPSFDNYIDVNYREGVFLIRNTLNANEEPIAIPNDLINMKEFG